MVVSFVLLYHLLQSLPALQEAIEKRRLKAQSHGLTLRWFLIGVEIDSECRHYYFILDTIKYHFTTVTGALDCLITSHNIKYSFQCKYMYTLIQRIIYCFKTPVDESSPNLVLFASQLQCNFLGGS